jgi:hypothetical protein
MKNPKTFTNLMMEEMKKDEAELPDFSCVDCRRIEGICKDCDYKFWEAVHKDGTAEAELGDE